MKFPGAQYADIDQNGVAHIAPPGFPADGLCRQMRCSRSGLKFAGLGSDDFVYEWVDGLWHDRGLYFGPRACIYRGEELIIRREWPAYGFRYIDMDGNPVTATETYAHPSLPIWEYTVLPNGWIVGQGGDGPWGEDPLVLIGHDGFRRLVQTGMCRFINAYLSDDMSRVLLAWQQDGRGADARVLSLDEAMKLPVAKATDPEPQPEPEPEPQPEPEPDMPDSLLPTVQAVRTKYDNPSQADLGKMLNEIAWKHRADGWGLSLKPNGNSTTQPKTGKKIAVDILHHKPSDTIWDCFRDAGGATEPSWGEAHPHNDPSRVWVAPVAPEGVEPQPEPEPEPEPQPEPQPGDDVPRLILAELRKLNSTLDRHLR